MRNKKRKQKKTVKKTRINKVESSFEGLKDGDYTIVYNQQVGLELIDKTGKVVAPLSVNTQQYYERDSRPKVVSYGDALISPNENISNILKNYKYLSAIDTNTRMVNGRLISVSIICLGIWVDEGETTKFSFWPELYMDVFDDKFKPERFAWSEFIKLMVKGESYDSIHSFGVIVDSELGDIPDINKRTMPLYENYFLPERMNLIYASADKAGTVQNIMIKKCDQLATERINYLEKHSEEIKEVSNGYVNISKMPERV